MRSSLWDKRFLDLAKHVSTWSKDPSTKCGAVIVRPNKSVASLGFNGFPQGCNDDIDILENREKKYERMVHCEINAILFSQESLQGYTLYVWPFLTCHRCATQVIQTGIERVVFPTCPPEKIERWKDSFDLSIELYQQAGVKIYEMYLPNEKN